MSTLWRAFSNVLDETITVFDRVSVDTKANAMRFSRFRTKAHLCDETLVACERRIRHVRINLLIRLKFTLTDSCSNLHYKSV